MSKRIVDWYRDFDLPDGLSYNNGRLKDEKGRMVYLTDGACRNNGRRNAKAGCAFFSGLKNWNSWNDPADPPTNQTAELRAILGAARNAIKRRERNIKILTDSKYAVDCLTLWVKDWRRKAKKNKTKTWMNALGQPVANQGLIERILKTMKFGRLWADFGHIPREENGIADRLAKDQIA